MVQEIKDLKEFHDLINGDKPTLIDFHAVWCGPCKVISPIVSKLAEKHTGVNFAKVDVDDVSDVAAEVGIKAMPTFLLFHKGEKIGEVIGANPGALATLAKQADLAAAA